MRKNIYHIGMLAVAALAFYACEKENNIDNNVEVTHYATISLGKADDTKTMVVEGQDGASYKWNDDDDKYLRVTENGTVGTIESFSLSADKTIATLTVSFTGTPEAPYTYEAIYAGSFSNNGNPKMSAEQTPLNDTFDPSADVLYSKTITSDNSRLNELSFTMGRVVTVNKMTLTGLEKGEVISKVEFTLDKVVNGSTSITYHSDSNSYSYSGTKKLTLNYDSTTGVVPADGKFPVYFTAAPVTDAPIISVIVTTDKNVYTKSTSCTPNPFDGKTISFAIGTMKRFNMAMDGYGETISSGTVYTLVQSQDDLYDGATYIIVGTDVDYAVGLFSGGNNHTAVAIAKSVDAQNKSIITIDNTIAVEPILLNNAGSNWTMKNNASESTYYGQYLICATGNNNRLQETSSESSALKEWTISVSNGVATIINANDSAVRTQLYYNANSGNPIFACYAPDQTINNYHTVALYVDLTTATPDTRAEAGLSWSTDNASASIEDGDIIQFTAPTLSNPNGVSGITYESTETSVATVSSEGTVTVIAAGTTTIKAIFAGDTDYKPQTVSYTLTVTDNRTPASTTIADVLAGGAGSYEVADVLVYAVKGSGLIIGDATGKMYAYKNGHNLSAGAVRTVNGTTTVYNDVYEFSDPTFSGTGTATVNHGTAVELDSQASALQSAFANPSTAVYVHAIGSQSSRNITTTGGTALYLSATESATDGKTVEIYGYVYAYSTSHSNFDILVTSIEEYVDPNAKSITALKSSISGISADGVTNATETGVYSLTNASDSDVTVTPDGTVVTAASISGGTLTYTVAANTGSARNGSVTLAVTGGNSITITISQLAGAGSTTTTYTKVTSAPSSWAGTYIIVYEESSSSGLVCLAGTDAYQNFTSATISSGVISSNDLADYEVEIASYSTGYSIKALGGNNANKFLEGKGSSSSNGTTFAASASKVTTFSLSGGVVTITNNTNLFVYNSTAGSNGERWRFYKSGTASGSAYKKPALYKKN